MSKQMRILSVLVSLVTIASLAAGCAAASSPGNSPSAAAATPAAATNTAASTTSAAVSQAPQSSASAAPQALHQISATPVTLTIWKAGTPAIGKVIKSYEENLAFAEMAKVSNVTLKFSTPVFGQEADKFNIMIASGEYPDLISGIAAYYSGGGDKAINDNVILKLNDYIAKDAPNYTAARTANADVKKATVTDSGNMYQFECIVDADAVEPPDWGLAIRQDWLDDLNLKAPVTFDDFHNVLLQFKEKKGATKPFLIDASGVPGYGSFLGGFGIYVQFPGGTVTPSEFFYQVDGKVKYGPIEPGYKDYVTLMAQWYKEGLVDPDFLSVKTWNDVTPLVSGGKVGISVLAEAQYKMYKTNSTDPKFRLVALACPVKKAGDKVHVAKMNSWTFPAFGVAISTSCKNPDLAVKYLDMWYTDSGTTLLNFGVEGLSYSMVNGAPKQNDLILNNPDKLSMMDAISKYCVYTFSMRRNYARFYDGVSDDQKNAHLAWLSNADTAYMMPNTTMTADEASSYAAVMNDINTYAQETTVKMIMGLTPLTDFDKMVQAIKDMGIDKAIAAKQAALGRYNAR